MKIIVIGNYAEWLINFRGPMLKKMAVLGHEVYACAPYASIEIQQKLHAIGVVYRHIFLYRGSLSPLKDVKSLFALVQLFRDIKPDIFLGYTVKPIIYGTLTAWLAGVPKRYTMVEGLGYVFSGNAKDRRLLKFFIRCLYRLIGRLNHKFFFLNPDDYRFFRQDGILKDPMKGIVLNGTGVDIDYFRPKPLPKAVSFILIARFLAEKGVREYAEAARRLKKKYPQVVFNLVGWLDHYPDTISKQELDSWIKTGSLNYLGRLDDVRPAIEASSVFVLPSYYREGTPRTIMEAMAMGRPIVTTDMPGCRETVKNLENGFLVPPKDIDALIEAMAFFMRNPDQVAKMGAESRRLVERKYDVHQVNRIILREMMVS